MQLIENIRENFHFFVSDFFSFIPNLLAIVHFFLNFIFSLVLLVMFYFIGKKIRTKFFANEKDYLFFFDILLGYIVAGTGIGILGMLHLFTPQLIIILLLILFVISLPRFSLPYINKTILQVKIYIKHTMSGDRFVTFGVLLFVCISFLRLLTPEIGEDSYHTDYLRQYLTWETTIHESREQLHVLSYPQLPEMIYTLPILLGEKEVTRFIHFDFYLLILLLLFTVVKEKKYSYAKYVPLLFATSPAVIKYSPTQYTDFFALFPFILSVILIKKHMSWKSIILSGICFGAMVSAKIWMLVYIPAIIGYMVILNRNIQKKRLVMMVIVFIVSYLLIAAIWYVRTIIIMGSPIYPILNQRETIEIYPLPRFALPAYFGFNWEMFLPRNILMLSPLFLVGVVLSFLYGRFVYKTVIKSPIIIFVVLITLEQLVARVSWGRYLLTWNIFTLFIISAGLLVVMKKSHFARVAISTCFIVFFSYYAINTIFLLPYGLDMANKNKLLTRTLIRQYGNYYDFDYLFGKHITKADLVGTYGVVNYYYADFHYIDVGYILDQRNTSFPLLKQAGITKLLLNGGDIQWFCQKLSLKNCHESDVTLLASYPENKQSFNLYQINK